MSLDDIAWIVFACIVAGSWQRSIWKRALRDQFFERGWWYR